MNIVNEAMLSLGVITEPGNPVISTWISTDTHYAFVEFRNADEANLGFRLHGMNINGSEIKIGRPKAYEGTMSAIGLQTGTGINQGPEEKDAVDDRKTKEEDEDALLLKAMEEYKV